MQVNEDSINELERTKQQLAAAEARGRHLAALLSEAERELALSTEQSQLLKEEVRRNQRSVEREQHLHNLEYLKNVLIKVSKTYKKILM